MTPEQLAKGQQIQAQLGGIERGRKDMVVGVATSYGVSAEDFKLQRACALLDEVLEERKVQLEAEFAAL